MEDFKTGQQTSDARIMIVDDDPNCVKGLMHLLEAQEYTLSIGFTDSSAALEQFGRVKPDLVLLDWHMEPLSGEHFLQSLHAHYPSDELPPILVMTGDTFPETTEKALEAGASDFLTKPLNQTEVVLRIRNHLRLRRLHQHVQSENERLEEIVHARTTKLRETIAELHVVQQQVIAEERMRALAVMAGGVAHDFNNALMVIRGYSELYAEPRQKEFSREELRKGFEIIALASHDAGEIVRRLGEFYRPFSNRGEVRQRVDLNNLVEESLALASPKWKTQCQARGISVTAEMDFQSLPAVAVAPAEIREVMINLIFNAVDAMPQGGRIVVRTRHEDDHVLVEVEDTGTGMTPETRQRCLEPFYSTKGEGGTGLGLSITYGIVQRHGGGIKVRSEIGKGTCFSLILPISAKAEEVLDDVLCLPVLHHLRVLVVDDDPGVCSVLAHYLQADEHSVTTAASGCEALEKFSANDYDLVITDRVMPKMSGDQLAAAIRERRPAEPIILLTGFEGREVPKEVNLLVSKPATMGTLREAISRAMTLNETFRLTPFHPVLSPSLTRQTSA